MTPTTTSETSGMRRRDVLIAAGASVLASGTAVAAEHDHAAHQAAASGPVAALIEAARACSAAGEDCLAHCLASFRAGETSLADCAGEVSRMLPACEAVAQLATLGSPHTKAFALACDAVCKDCEAACRKHEAEHAVCKACADACARFRKAVAALPA